MKTAQHDDFAQIVGQIRVTMDELWQWHTADFCPAESWAPRINMYRVKQTLQVCVDLAGVDRERIDLRIEPGKLLISGVRIAPEPARGANDRMRILAMEIDHGQFCRSIALPDHVELARVTSKYDQGFLWIHLPLRVPG